MKCVCGRLKPYLQFMGFKVGSEILFLVLPTKLF